jgi:hypothetical protein
MRPSERRRVPARPGQSHTVRRRHTHRPGTVARRVQRIDRFDAAFVKAVLWVSVALTVVSVAAALAT